MPVNFNLLRQAGPANFAEGLMQGQEQQNALMQQQQQRQLNEVQLRNALRGEQEALAESEAAKGSTSLEDLARRQRQAGLGRQALATEAAAAKQRTEKLTNAKTQLDLMKTAAGQIMANPESAVQVLTRFGQITGTDMSDDIAMVQRMNPEGIKKWAAGHALEADKLLPEFGKRDLGGTIQEYRRDRVTGEIIGTPTIIQKTAAPGEVLGAETTRRGQDIGATTAARGQDITVRGQDIGAATAARGQDITVRGQDIGATTAIRGQDIGAQTAAAGQAVTRRGQDITAATAKRGQDLQRELSLKPTFNAQAGGFVVPPSAAAPQGAFIPLSGISETKDQKNAAAALKSAGYDPETGNDRIEELIAKSTGGLAGATIDAVAAFFNKTTEGRAAIGALASRANQIALDMAGGKLGAGISNADRDFIVSTLGDVANPLKPVGERLAAWKEARARMLTSGFVPPPKAPGGTPALPPGFTPDNR